MSTVYRVISQNGLGQKWLLLRQESCDWFSFSGDHLSYLLTFPCTSLSLCQERGQHGLLGGVGSGSQVVGRL